MSQYVTSVLISFSRSIVANAAQGSSSFRQLEVYHFAHEIMLFSYCATVVELTGILHIDHSYPCG